MSAEELGLYDQFSSVLRELKAEAFFARRREELESLLKAILGRHGISKAILAGIPDDLSGTVISALGEKKFFQAESLRGSETLETCNGADLGITWAEYAIASTGALVEIVRDDVLKLASSLPFVHVALVPYSRFLKGLPEAITQIGKIIRSSDKVSLPVISFIAGPSKTADIELKQLYGVHGPNSLYVVVLGWI